MNLTFTVQHHDVHCAQEPPSQRAYHVSCYSPLPKLWPDLLLCCLIHSMYVTYQNLIWQLWLLVGLLIPFPQGQNWCMTLELHFVQKKVEIYQSSNLLFKHKTYIYILTYKVLVLQNWIFKLICRVSRVMGNSEIYCFWLTGWWTCWPICCRPKKKKKKKNK